MPLFFFNNAGQALYQDGTFLSWTSGFLKKQVSCEVIVPMVFCSRLRAAGAGIGYKSEQEPRPWPSNDVMLLT